MTEEKHTSVPASRLKRFGRFTRLAGRVAKGTAAEGIRQLAAGNRPKLRDMVLTPANAKRLTEELSKMRGAAMKLGQMLSMDSGDFIPEELTQILAHLRADAHYMPYRQLEQQLELAYGEQWATQFASFERTPIAAASIGQVHRATSHEGTELALKIQYPGVRDSIDSDVSNLATLLRMTGLLPRGIDLTPILDEVRKQLREEASYLQEAQYLETYGEHLAGDERFILPALIKDQSRDNILVMSYIESSPIDFLKQQPQPVRDQAVSHLFELFLRELFELRLMQTDPNFANYRYQVESGKLVLLDFGATRKFTAKFSSGYLRLIKAMVSRDESRILKAAQNIGYHSEGISAEYEQLLLRIFLMVGEIFDSSEPYDFERSDLVVRLNRLNDDVMRFQSEWKAPPVDCLYVHRKLGGLYLMARRLRARVAIGALLEKYL